MSRDKQLFQSYCTRYGPLPIKEGACLLKVGMFDLVIPVPGYSYIPSTSSSSH